jgi:hypothetical protein
LGLIAVIRHFRRPAPQGAAPELTPEEQRRLDDLLDGKDEK